MDLEIDMLTEILGNNMATLQNLYQVVTSSPLFLMLILAVAVIMFNRITDIRHYYTEKFMRFTNKELRDIRIESVERFKTYLKDNNKFVSDVCLDCIHPQGSFIGSVRISLAETSHAIKAIRYKNHFHKLQGDELDEFVRVELKSLLADSQDSMVSNSVGLGGEIYSSNNQRFSEDEGFVVLLRILKYSQKLKKQENKEIAGMISGISLAVKLVKGLVK